jgi:hypothetical protein
LSAPVIVFPVVVVWLWQVWQENATCAPWLFFLFVSEAYAGGFPWQASHASGPDVPHVTEFAVTEPNFTLVPSLWQ